MKTFFKNKKIMKIIYIIMTLSFITISVFLLKNRNSNKEDIYKIHKVTVSDELTFAGIVESERRSDLGFAVGGRVIKNKVNEGDFVKKGDLLAEVNQSNVRAGLTQAYANYKLTKIDNNTSVDISEKAYDELKKQQDAIVSNLYQQYISGDLRAYLVDKDNLNSEYISPIVSGNYNGEGIGSYIIDMYRSSAYSNYSYHISGLENGTETAEVFQPGALLNSGLYLQFNNDTRYDDTKWEIPVPNVRSVTYLSRKSAYEDAIAYRNKILTDAKNNINKLVMKDNSLDLSLGDARIKNAKAQINANNIRLLDGKIVAPFSGYIVKNNLEIGETVQGFIPQIIIFANKKKKLVLNTPEIYINKIKKGDSVDIIIDAYPDIIFKGEISKIDDIDTFVDGVPVYETEVTINNEDDRIRVGMNAHAHIVSFKKEGVIGIPRHFLYKENGHYYVLIKNKNKEIIKKNVKIGNEGNNGLVEIISGLKDGQIIIKKND